MKRARDIAVRIAVAPFIAAGLAATVIGISTVTMAVIAYGYITTPKEDRSDNHR